MSVKRRVAAVVVEGGSKLYHRFSCCNKTVSECEGKDRESIQYYFSWLWFYPCFYNKTGCLHMCTIWTNTRISRDKMRETNSKNLSSLFAEESL